MDTTADGMQGLSDHILDVKQACRKDTESLIQAMMEARTESILNSISRTTSNGKSWSRGGNESVSRALHPFYEINLKERVSSRTFETWEEFLKKKIQAIMNCPKGWFFVSPPYGKTRQFRAIRMTELEGGKERYPLLVQGAVSKPCYLLPAPVEEKKIDPSTMDEL